VSALILVAFLACLVAALIGISAVAVVSLRLEGRAWSEILSFGWHQ
jgi:hypothetical protein